jgi:two-component system OmpR family response regulator
MRGSETRLNRTVLVVEDDPAIREVLALAIGEDLGVPVAVARDGAAALAQAKELAPAVIVLDLMLPETDGFQVARRLRADAGTSWTWIIAISAAGEMMESAAKNAGCDEFVPKPFDLDDIVGRVAAALEQAGRSEDPGNMVRFRGSA